MYLGDYGTVLASCMSVRLYNVMTYVAHTCNLYCIFPQPSKAHHKLICYYYDAGRNPRLIIRPAKVEVVYPDPKLYVLREVISKTEMARLKELAAPIVSIA